ncbi:MAG: hypothetical protein LBE12_00395 [Planctomycetaceae bacterium]|jgi:hypothetical protein|nr:hypothetical protein [Planctomycetaceae bacterium]
MANLLKRILVDIKTSYGSFSEPDWSFLRTMKNTYQALINDLNQNESISSFFSIQDVSGYMGSGYVPMLNLVHDNQRWSLWLTFVGRYAYFSKNLEGRNYKVISHNEDCDIPEEIEILAILKNHAIIPLTKQIVHLQVPEFKMREYISDPIEIPTIRDILFFET